MKIPRFTRQKHTKKYFHHLRMGRRRATPCEPFRPLARFFTPSRANAFSFPGAADHRAAAGEAEKDEERKERREAPELRDEFRAGQLSEILLAGKDLDAAGMLFTMDQPVHETRTGFRDIRKRQR